MTEKQKDTIRSLCQEAVRCGIEEDHDGTVSSIETVVLEVEGMIDNTMNPCPQTCSIVKSDTATVGPIFCTENANYAWRRQDGTVAGVCWAHAMALHLVVERLVPAYDTVVEILKRD